MRSTILLGLLLLVCSTAYCEVNMPKLLPSPQVIRLNSTDNLKVTALKNFILGKNCSSAKAGVNKVNARLKEINQQSLSYLNTGKPGQHGTVWVGLQSNATTEKIFGGLPKPGNQGYRLAVGPDWIVIIGKDLPGLFYGLMTLKQLIQVDGTVPQVSISDWPDLNLRGTYSGEPDPEKWIEYFASLKLNFVVYESDDFYHLDNPVILKRWQNIFDLCRKHFIEPIPELQSFGHGHTNISMEPRCVEGIYKQNVPAEAKNGSIVFVTNKSVPSGNIIVNADFEQSNDSPTGWSVDDGDVALDKTEKHGGTSSLRISRQSRGMIRAWQNIQCLDQTDYKLTFHIKTKDVFKDENAFSGAYAEIYGVTENDSLSPTLMMLSSINSGTNDWTQLSYTFNTLEYKKIRIYLRIQNSYGTAWFDDLDLSCLGNSNQISPNVIITHNSPVVVTNKSGDIKYKEGQDFKVIPGDPLAAESIFTGKIDPSKERKLLALQTISGGRINEGDELLVSYNYAPVGSASCCPSEPLYRELMHKSIQSVIKNLKCKYLHIGHDEPQALNRDSRCKARGLSNAELYVDEIKRMRQYVAEADPNCKVMMWDDTLNPYSNAPALQLESAAQYLPKDIIMNIWAYGYPEDNEKIQKSIKFFTDLGFDITGSPWFNCYNAHFWDQELKKSKNTGHILGSFYTAWHDVPGKAWLALTTSAQYAWSDTVPLEEFLASKDK